MENKKDLQANVCKKYGISRAELQAGVDHYSKLATGRFAGDSMVLLAILELLTSGDIEATDNVCNFSAEHYLERLKNFKTEDQEMLFNEGWFNDIATGYGKIALKNMGMKADDLDLFERCIKDAFDFYDATAAREQYRKASIVGDGDA